MQNIIPILMVEDNLDEAELIQEMLKAIPQSKFSTIHKTNLADAIEFLHRPVSDGDQIDLVLLDLHLPDVC